MFIDYLESLKKYADAKLGFVSGAKDLVIFYPLIIKLGLKLVLV
jgi:hypothetical protein